MTPTQKLDMMYVSFTPFFYIKNPSVTSQRAVVELRSWKPRTSLATLSTLTEDLHRLIGVALDDFNGRQQDLTARILGRFASYADVRCCFRPLFQESQISSIFLDDIFDLASLPWTVAVETSLNNFQCHLELSRKVSKLEAQLLFQAFRNDYTFDTGATKIEQPRRLPSSGLRSLYRPVLVNVDDILAISTGHAVSPARAEPHGEFSIATSQSLQPLWDAIARSAPRKTDGITPDFSVVDHRLILQKADEGWNAEQILDALDEVVRSDGRKLNDKIPDRQLRLAYVERSMTHARGPVTRNLALKL